MLYVVATPIGNLNDISLRARDTLQEVDIIASEDTRRAKKLLNHLNIKKKLIALHEHNEIEQSKKLIEQLKAKQKIALITDAGTPLISDPGLPLVRLAHENDIQVIPIPGPCALITALSASGVATDRFTFEGFLPAKSLNRKKSLAKLSFETRTMIFYEAPHRIVASLQDMLEVFGAERQVVLARELTKKFETVKATTLERLAEWVVSDSQQQLGEIVVVVAGFKAKDSDEQQAQQLQEAQRILAILLKELPLTQAASLAAKITGLTKKELYDFGLRLSDV